MLVAYGLAVQAALGAGAADGKRRRESVVAVVLELDGGAERPVAEGRALVDALLAVEAVATEDRAHAGRRFDRDADRAGVRWQQIGLEAERPPLRVLEAVAPARARRLAEARHRRLELGALERSALDLDPQPSCVALPQLEVEDELRVRARPERFERGAVQVDLLLGPAEVALDFVPATVARGVRGAQGEQAGAEGEK